MKNLKRMFLLLALASLSLTVGAVEENMTETHDATVRDTIKTGIKVKENKMSWDEYRPERGFFQKAFADKSDPRFMIANEDETFMLGIGGKFRITAFCDVGGAVNHKSFSSWDIPVPTDKATHFGLNVASSNLYVKSKIKLGKQLLTAYIGIESDDENKIKLDQAYVSYGGLSMGATYSFFVDLAAGVHLVDRKGINTAVSRTHPLIGYTTELGKHWILGAAIESSDQELPDITPTGVLQEYDPMPDFAMRGIVKGDWGHLQLSALLRSLTYWSIDSPLGPTFTSLDGSTKHKFGYGVSFSGKWNITNNLFATFQSIYGEGIQKYIRDCSSQKLDLVPYMSDVNGQMLPRMKTVPVYGGYLGLQYKWNQKFSSAAAIGLLGMNLDKYPTIDPQKYSMKDIYNVSKLIDYRSTSYIVVNTFYHLNDYCTFGIEYLHGSRWQRGRDLDTMELTGKTVRGDANRIDLMCSYSF